MGWGPQKRTLCACVRVFVCVWKTLEWHCGASFDDAVRCVLNCCCVPLCQCCLYSLALTYTQLIQIVPFGAGGSRCEVAAGWRVHCRLCCPWPLPPTLHCFQQGRVSKKKVVKSVAKRKNREREREHWFTMSPGYFGSEWQTKARCQTCARTHTPSLPNILQATVLLL